MQDINDYALGVWNGEIGIVIEKEGNQWKGQR